MFYVLIDNVPYGHSYSLCHWDIFLYVRCLCVDGDFHLDPFGFAQIEWVSAECSSMFLKHSQGCASYVSRQV